MQIIHDELALSLGYQLVNENGASFYMKDNLRWIDDYLILENKLQQKQQSPLSFDDVENYGYHIDDYFFYNYQNKNPNNISVARQQKWINKGLANFHNFLFKDANPEIISGKDYLFYALNHTKTIPINFFVYDNKWEYELFIDIRNCSINVRQSVENALNCGYEYLQTKSQEEFRPFMFRKSEECKWIHDIGRLGQKLQINSIQDLMDKGYNVDDYYIYNCTNWDTELYSKLWEEERLNILRKIVNDVENIVNIPQATQSEIEKILQMHLQQYYENFHIYSNAIQVLVSEIQKRNDLKSSPT